MPEVLSRLRRDAERRLDGPKEPRWAGPAGWIIAVGIVVVVIVALIEANPF